MIRSSLALKKCNQRWRGTPGPRARPTSISSVLKTCVVSASMGRGRVPALQAFGEGFPGEEALFTYSCPNVSWKSL